MPMGHVHYSRRISCTLLALVALTAASRGLLAQDEEGPRVLSARRERPPILTLDPFSGALETKAIYQADSTRGGGQSASSTDMLLQQTLTLVSGGGVVSKNVVDWHGTVTAGLEEEWTHVPGASQTGLGLVDTYDLTATILRHGAVPVTLYDRRSENYINRSFAGLLKDTSTEYGAFASYSPIPTTLHVYRSETLEADSGGRTQYTLNSNNLEFQTEYQPDERHDLTLNYQFQGVDQTNTDLTSSSFNSQSLDATYAWILDPKGKYDLTTTLNYNDQSGDFSYRNIRLDEMLRMRHTENFDTFLEYAYNQQSFGDSIDQSHKGIAGFSHQLFSSLKTTGQLGTSLDQRNDGGTISEWFANVNWGYSKKVPLGVLSADLALAHDQTDTSATGSVTPVVRESHTFTDPAPIILTRAGIDPRSLVVFDARGTRRLVQGVDYTVTSTPQQVELRRVIGGAISADDSVLMDYDINPLPAHTALTDTLGLGGRYDFTQGWFNGLGFYARYVHQSQQIESAVPTILVPNEFSDTTIGSDYRIWKLTFNAEQQNHEATLAPFNATRFSARYAQRLGDRSILSLTANQTFLDYPPSRTTDFTLVTGKFEYQITRYWKSSLYAAWRNEVDSEFGHTQGFEGSAELRWHRRQTEVYFQLRQTFLTTGNEENQSLYFQMGLRREF